LGAGVKLWTGGSSDVWIEIVPSGRIDIPVTRRPSFRAALMARSADAWVNGARRVMILERCPQPRDARGLPNIICGLTPNNPGDLLSPLFDGGQR
jgi:hypothetical protein